MSSFKNKNEIKKIYFKPLIDLVEQSHSIHKKHFKTHLIQASKLLSIKTGACPEDCAYCSQSSRYETKIQKEKLLDLQTVIFKAKKAKEEGATRFCLGASWREVKDNRPFENVLEMVKEIKKLHMEVCCTLGMLSLNQAKKLKKAGLDAYNHNLDTSPEFYPKIISTRSYQDRLNTLKNVRQAGLTICTGGILGLGESHEDRCSFIQQLCFINPPPESITINTLIPIKGTPLENQKAISVLDVVRVIAVCRILMPHSMIRLSAGRSQQSLTEQFMCFYAGANSLFIGNKLLTADNPELSTDHNMLESLGLKMKAQKESLKV
ncbi:MAG: biotin synthase BioB [Bdellovibrionales bacterium]|nr:biotin synthase BioB [Bdellovibrionales bacterium]